MDELFLTLPEERYCQQIVDFRREYLEAGSSMDGCGALRRTDDPLAFLQACRDDTAMETLRPGRVMATLFLCVRRSDDKILGMILSATISTNTWKNMPDTSVIPSAPRSGARATPRKCSVWRSPSAVSLG